jgi:two-component system response regulator
MTYRSVLLVEDEADDCELAKLALHRAGVACRLDIVRDGVELVDYLFHTGEYRHRESEEMPQLILLDLKLPRLNGLQILQMLRRIRWDDRENLPPVVVLTSSDQEEDIVQAYHLGAHSYVRKPVDFAEFTQLIKTLLNYWLNVNVPPPHLQKLSGVIAR